MAEGAQFSKSTVFVYAHGNDGNVSLRRGGNGNNICDKKFRLLHSITALWDSRKAVQLE